MTQQYLAGENKGFVGSSISVVEIPPSDRREPVEFNGVTEDGSSFDSRSVDGAIVVNFWYATCGPCRAEADELENAWQELQSEDVTFIGINTRDQPGTARAFAEKYGVTYPSLIDATSDETPRLAFAAETPIQATPTTLVLDGDPTWLTLSGFQRVGVA